MTTRPDRSFLAPPDQVSDWRMVLVYDAAADAGVFSALPGTSAQVADSLGLDPRAVRVVLDLLAVWDIVEHGPDGQYVHGSQAPGPDRDALLRHHGRSMRLWSDTLAARLRGVEPCASRPPSLGQRELWYAALAAFARPAAPAAIDACLSRFPDTRCVLDLGGGHGEHSMAFARRGRSVTMQDRSPAIDLARRTGRLEEQGVTLFEGDFFQTLPEGPFDLVFCAAVTDTYDGAANAALYRLLRSVTTPGGGIALLAFVRGRNPMVAAFAVQMLNVPGGGDTHTEHDYRQWLTQAGFDGIEVLDLTGQAQSLVLANRQADHGQAAAR